MIRVVLDANVLVSAYLNVSGKPAKIFSLSRENRIEICLSPRLSPRLQKPFLNQGSSRYTKATREKCLFCRTLSGIATITPGLIEVDAVEADPDDNKILACAIEAHADFIISGDHHLTDLKEYKNIRIINPDTFLKLIEDQF
jgi:putative PIN family toxin of toxin-antitoxin system